MWLTSTDTNLQQNALKFQPCGYDDGGGGDDDPFVIFDNTGGPPYPQVIRNNTYRRYAKMQTIPNAIYNMIFV